MKIKYYLKEKTNEIAEKTRLWIQDFRWQELSIIRRILFFIGLLLFFVFPISAFVTHKIDDDLSFQIQKNEKPQIVSNIIALINREVLDNGWIANKPFFFPQALLLDNMPNFQKGILFGLSVITSTLAKSSENINFIETTKALNTPGDKWGFGENSASGQYIKARNILQREDVDFTMDKELFFAIIKDTKKSLNNRFYENSDFINETDLLKSDNEFFYNKGMLYSFYITIRDSFFEIKDIEENNYIETHTEELLNLMKKAINYEPLVIFAFEGSSTIISNHLMVQNYYIAEIILTMEEILKGR